MYLCYKTPAAPSYAGWTDRAIPLGNGSIGARVFGGVQREMIQFNEKTLFSGDKDKTGSFQAFGEIFLSFNEKVPCSENTYLRDLDFETGSAMVACQKGLDGHTRHYFISAADNILVGKIESTGDTMLDFTLSLQSEQNGEITYDGAYAIMRGTVNANNGVGNESGEDKNGLEYICVVRVIPDDGVMQTSEEGITVRETFGARIVMSCATSYYGKEKIAECTERVDAAAETSFPLLFKRHLAEYKDIMGRAKLGICQTDENLTTDSQLKLYTKTKNKQNLEALLFEFGKYILYTACGRDSLPITESGIWNSLNKQEKGEILIDTKKVKQAARTASLLGMDELNKGADDFVALHTDEARYNPFGKTIPSQAPARTKPSAFSKLLKKEKNPLEAGTYIDALEKAVRSNKPADAYKNIGSFITSVRDNLFAYDIFDNITYTNLVCDMLLSECGGVLTLLPCLPVQWEIGSITGLRKGNFEVSFEWGSGKFRKGTVKAMKDGVCRINAGGKFIGVSDEDGNDVEEKFENGVVSFEASEGKTYTLY